MVDKICKFVPLALMTLLMLLVNYSIFVQAFIYSNVFYIALAIIGLVSWLLMLVWALRHMDDPEPVRENESSEVSPVYDLTFTHPEGYEYQDTDC